MRGYHHHRAFAVSSVKGLIEIGLLGLGRHSGTRARSLDINDDQGKFRHHSQAEGFGFE